MSLGRNSGISTGPIVKLQMERRAFRNHLVCADKELGVPILRIILTPSCNLDTPTAIITCTIGDGGY